MKIVYVINSLEGGGAERVFAELVSLTPYWQSENQSVDVILLDDKPDVYSLPDNVRVHRVGYGDGLPVIRSVMQCVAFLRCVIRLRPELLVSFLTRANLHSVLAAKLLGVRVMISERSNTKGRLKGRMQAIKHSLVAIFYRQADQVLAVSQGVAECLQKDFRIDSRKIGVLNNPVNIERINRQADLSTSKQWPSGSLVAMGRLVKSKGFDDLIRAYHAAGLQCGLTILGEGPEKEALQKLATELDVQVAFHGFVANPYPIIKQSLAFVLSSKLEGFPNALVEAMALGRPVIATNCQDGPSEILDHSQAIPCGQYAHTKFGFMVNVGDVAGLSKAMANVCENGNLRQTLGQAARARLQLYTPDKFAERFAGYVTCLNQPTTCNA